MHSITPGAYITDAAIHPRRGDTSWQKVSFEYLATGEEVYLTLGNFSKRDITGSTNIPLQNSFLVFFDDISLTPVDVNEQLCNNWLATKEEIYSFAARHQFLDIYVKRHSNNSPETPKIARTIIRTIDTLVLPDILFETDRSELNKKSFYVLDSLCDLLKNMQVDSMVVEGSTDNSGTATHNKKLSSDRALSVTRYVIEKSLLNSRLVVSRGLGSEKPIGNNETPEGRQLNRRVEIFIYIGKSF